APDLLRRAGLAVARDRLDRLLRGAVLDIGRDELHGEKQHDGDDEQRDDETGEGDAALGKPVVHSCSPVQRNDPKRPSSFRLSQMKNALPTMFSSGTNPHTRLSLELSRLSPIMKYCPGGTVHATPLIL